MAITRTYSFASNKRSWGCELLFFIAGFMIAFGFTAWFIYGMIKDVFASISIRALVTKSRK